MSADKPLIVCSKHDVPQLAALIELQDRVQLSTLAAATKCQASVVYMRAAHRLSDDELLEAQKVEAEFRRRGARIVNSIGNRVTGQRKDLYYAVLAAHGVQVPFFIPQPEWREVHWALTGGKLKYPFLVRTVDGAGGHGMWLVRNDTEFHARSEQMWAQRKRWMAVEFLHSNRDEYFFKARAYAIGGKVDMWGASISKSWNTQDFGSAKFAIRDFVKANRDSQLQIGSDEARLNAAVAKIGEVLDMELYAVDIVPSRDRSRYFVVDVNPTYVTFRLPVGFPADLKKTRNGHFERLVTWLEGLGRDEAGVVPPAVTAADRRAYVA